ncbi:MAG: PepSY domain-containing protein [Phycisphaerales bacterium]
MRSSIKAAALPLALVLAVFAGAFAARHALAVREAAPTEQVITLNEAPEPVRAAALRAAPEASIKEIVRETDGGATLYEIEYEDNGVACEMTLSPSGDLIASERGVPLTRLPQAAADAVAALHPGATITHVKIVTETYYEVVAESSGKAIEVEVNAAGGPGEDDDTDDGNGADAPR